MMPENQKKQTNNNNNKNRITRVLGKNWQNENRIVIRLQKISDTFLIDFSKHNLNNIEFLDLSKYDLISVNTNITGLGISALVSNELAKLKTLKVDQNRIKESILALIKKGIQNLSASHCKITHISLIGIPKSQIVLPKVLDLSYNKIGSCGFKLLLKADMSQLIQLYINQCQLGNEGRKHFSKANCYKLKILQMDQKFNNNEFLEHSINCKQLFKFNGFFEAISILSLVATNFSSRLWFDMPPRFRQYFPPKTILLKMVQRSIRKSFRVIS